MLLGLILLLFYRWSWRSTAHFNAVRVVVTYGHISDNAASNTTVGATVPLKRGRWVSYLVEALYCPFSCGWLCDPLLYCPPTLLLG